MNINDNQDIILMLNFCFRNARLPKMKIGTSESNYGTKLLQRISEKIKKALSNELDGHIIYYSRGSGYFPNIPWIGIVKKGRRVSDSMSATVCFAKDGAGIVVGAMLPYTSDKGRIKTTRIPLEGDSSINIKGSKPSTQYNNKFINPLILRKEEIDITKIVSHLSDSIKLVKENPTAW